MTGDKTKFCMLTETESGQVTFRGNTKGKIIRTDKVGKNSSSYINDVMFVEGLAYNLLSISQLCDKGCKVTFHSQICIIFESNYEIYKKESKQHVHNKSR